MQGPLLPIFLAAAEAAPATDSAVTEIVIAALSAGGLGAILAAVITGLFSKRKLGAEATEIITKAAAGVVTNLQSEVERQVQLRQTAEQEHHEFIEELRRSHDLEMEEVRRVLQLHVAWDAIAIAKLGDLGVSLPPAPPLLPPSKIEHPTLDDLH